MRKFTLHLKLFVLLCLCQFFTAFTYVVSADEQTEALQGILISHYDEAAAHMPLKRYELNVTNSGFCRYKRFYVNGKVEYFSFNLEKFGQLDYYGTDKQGELWLRTKGEDVIVQTYNDNEGDVDSMATYMAIPFKNIEAEELTDLSNKLLKITAQRLAQK
jgi:hypothetical protein